MRGLHSRPTLSGALCLAVLVGCGESVGPEAACRDHEVQAMASVSPCRDADTLCTRYHSIWMAEKMARNGMTRSWFDRHVVIRDAWFAEWNDGISFTVSYAVRIAWAVVEDRDAFIVNLSSSVLAYQHVPVPRDEYFDREEVAIALDAGVSNSWITQVDPVEELAFCSESEALSALRSIGGIERLEVQRYRYRDGYRPEANGHPWMEAVAELDLDQNRCADGRLDLVAGEGEAREMACWISKQTTP